MYTLRKTIKPEVKQYEYPVRIWIHVCDFLLPHMRKRIVIEQTHNGTILYERVNVARPSQIKRKLTGSLAYTVCQSFSATCCFSFM